MNADLVRAAGHRLGFEQGRFRAAFQDAEAGFGGLADARIDLHPADLSRVRADGVAADPLGFARRTLNDDQIRLAHLP